MNKINDRIKIWKKLAQETQAAPLAVPQFTVTQIPTFKSSLFSAKPEFILDMQTIIGLLNKYLFLLSGGKIDFSVTWKSGSLGPSQFTGGLKNIHSLAKWIYSVVSFGGEPYTLNGLKKIIVALSDTVSKMDFPEPQATSFKSEVVSAAQVLINKLG